jgi:F0F1-type ATP synthase membrane subunit b/b'
MPPQTIENRVDRLEERVAELEKLPERVTAIESQIVQFRTEMRVEFSAAREEVRAGDDETRHVLGERIEDTRRTLDERIEDTRRTLGDQIVETRRALGEEIVETRRALSEQILETSPRGRDRAPGDHSRDSVSDSAGPAERRLRSPGSSVPSQWFAT